MANPTLKAQAVGRAKLRELLDPITDPMVRRWLMRLILRGGRVKLEERPQLAAAAEEK